MAIEKCYDIVEELLGDTIKKIGSPNDEKLYKLRLNCNAIDQLADELHASAIEATLTKPSRSIVIRLILDDLNREIMRDSNLYRVAKNALKVGFEYAGGEADSAVVLVFPSVWDEG